MLAVAEDVLAAVDFSQSTAWRVEFYARARSNGRAAYFQYRRGSGKSREARYGGAFSVAWRKHNARAREFLLRASWTPTNLPTEAKRWLETQKVMA